MGSYKYGYKSPNMVHNYSYPLITLLITTHEPPSGSWISDSTINAAGSGSGFGFLAASGSAL